MRKSNFNFTIPQRQSYVAILMIIWKTYRVLIRQVFPFLVIFFVGKSTKNNFGNYFLYFVIAVALIGMLYSILSFFRYYFHIVEDKLIVEKGVFGRSKTIIPFERIQTINFEQNLAHQVFSVIRLKVDTAGSAQKEFEFDAIAIDQAQALRKIVLEKKSKLVSFVKTSDNKEDSIDEKIGYKSILKLSIIDLIKVGITENHFRSGALILFALWWIWDNLREAGLDPEKYTEDIDPLAGGVIILIGLAVIFIILAFLFSLIRTVLNYFGLEFWRSNNGFKISSGLFTKKDTSALDHKIQMISWSDNLLRKIVGYYQLSLKQASSVAINIKTSINIPGCRQDQIDMVTRALYGVNAFDGIEMESVNKIFMYRRMFFLSLLGAPFLLLGYFNNNPFVIISGVLFIIYFLITSYFRYKKCKFGHNEKMMIIRGGLFGDKAETLPLIKLQNVEISQSPYQRRKKLANVKIHTAAGNVTIPYVDYNRAIQLSNYILYKTESSNKRWM